MPSSSVIRRFALRCVTVLFAVLFSPFLPAQQITGVWRGKIDKKKAEIKIVQKGDSLTGTAYYYESSDRYRRYSIKGYFDPLSNSAVWWDDRLLEEKGTSVLGLPGKNPLLSVADFNCPGGGEMYLEGDAALKENRSEVKGPVTLTKVQTPSFTDEWNYVIDNYTVGANDPYMIDSVGLIAAAPEPIAVEKPTGRTIVREPVADKKPDMVFVPPMPEPKREEPKREKPLTIEEKFTTRQKVFTTEIPVEGDSIELRFYDNAEIDGDSISLFLNDKLLFTHIRLTDQAYVIKLPVGELAETNELIMVAENLGSIPPNTSYMVALVGGKRYEAKLASTENSSAMIRLRKMPSAKSAVK